MKSAQYNPTSLSPRYKLKLANDPLMQQLIKYIIEGWPARQQDVIQQLQSYRTFKEEMSVTDGLIFKGESLKVIWNYNPKALETIHRVTHGYPKDPRQI